MSQVISVIYLQLGTEPQNLARAQAAFAALAAGTGYLRGSLSRSTDDTDELAYDWVLVTEWRNVGSYRRALGASAVKMTLPLLRVGSPELPTSFEELLTIDPDGTVHHHESDRA